VTRQRRSQEGGGHVVEVKACSLSASTALERLSMLHMFLFDGIRQTSRGNVGEDNQVGKIIESEDSRPKKSTIGEVVENLGVVYRHMLPGVLIVGTLWLVRPGWFAEFTFEWPYLTVAAVIATALGNAAFALNRYLFHQTIDLVCWLFKSPGPARAKGFNYAADLATYVKKGFTSLASESAQQRISLTSARQHINFRASSVLLIYLIGELILTIALMDEGHHRLWLYALSGIIIGGGVGQNILTRRIDAEITQNPDREPVAEMFGWCRRLHSARNQQEPRNGFSDLLGVAELHQLR
jgi:hypothetical protein